MAGFRTVFTGEEHALSFLCERCTRPRMNSSFDTYNRPYAGHFRHFGECVSCEGTGFNPRKDSKLCNECGGSGICSDCNGKYSREWFGLSPYMREELLEHWEIYNIRPRHYAAVAGLYRNW